MAFVTDLFNVQHDAFLNGLRPHIGRHLPGCENCVDRLFSELWTYKQCLNFFGEAMPVAVARILKKASIGTLFSPYIRLK